MPSIPPPARSPFDFPQDERPGCSQVLELSSCPEWTGGLPIPARLAQAERGAIRGVLVWLYEGWGQGFWIPARGPE